MSILCTLLTLEYNRTKGMTLPFTHTSSENVFRPNAELDRRGPDNNELRRSALEQREDEGEK